VFAYLVVNFPDWKYGNKVSSDHYEKKQSSLLDLALGRGRYFLLDDDVKTEEPPSDSDKGAIVRLLRQGYIVKPCDWTIQKTIWEGWKDLGSVLHALPIDVVRFLIRYCGKMVLIQWDK
jgi:hypothetical protein